MSINSKKKKKKTQKSRSKKGKGICDNTNGPWGHYVKQYLSQTKKNKYCMMSPICGIFLKLYS